MNLADLPATLAITNIAALDIGIANIRIPSGGTVTVNLGQMGPERRSAVWIAATAANRANLVTTSPPTVAIADAWYSSPHHHSRPRLQAGLGGQGSPGASLDGVHVITSGTDAIPGSDSVPAPDTAPSADFSQASNSQYAAILLYI